MLLTYSRKYRTKLWLTITLWWTPKSRQKSTEFKLCIELSFHLNNIVRMVFLLSRSVLVSRRMNHLFRYAPQMIHPPGQGIYPQSWLLRPQRPDIQHRMLNFPMTGGVVIHCKKQSVLSASVHDLSFFQCYNPTILA